MRATEILFRNARLPDGAAADISVIDGRIASIGRGGAPAPDAAVIDLHGRLVLPGFVEGHIHLDKGFLGEAWKPHAPCTAGFDVRERVAFEKKAFASARPVAERATAMIERCVSRGTTRMRTHVDIDPQVGLANLEAVVTVRDAHRHLLDIEIVAFPQSGIVAAPGTAELLADAMRHGASLVGGLDPASFDNDINGHLDVVFGVAERHGAGVDIHLHDADMLGIFELSEIAHRPKALGLGGKVTVSHAYALGQVPRDVARRTADSLADAGVAILTNAPGSMAFPPILLLREAGVTVFGGNDNIRDAWWPFGDGDLLERAMIIGYRSGFHTDAELAVGFDMVTASAARAMRVETYGLITGANADFVTLDAAHVQEAIVERPRSRDVYKAGRLIARDGAVVAAQPAA